LLSCTDGHQQKVTALDNFQTSRKADRPAAGCRAPDGREECWHIYDGDVYAGTIAIRTGNPHDEDPWEWHCGFYPGSNPSEQQNGTAATFDEARADFGSAWQVLLSKRTEADFQAWRDQRDWTARKYALWDTGKRLPPNEWEPGKPCSIYFETLVRQYLQQSPDRGKLGPRPSHHAGARASLRVKQRAGNGHSTIRFPCLAVASSSSVRTPPPIS
jgi:hypothetical protein